ncbi:MAG: EAL domain-containing protein [Nitriliruptorales bacterium]|nr:EAL domain-containing protein [Nitriliruptorales bacterium]
MSALDRKLRRYVLTVVVSGALTLIALLLSTDWRAVRERPALYLSLLLLLFVGEMRPINIVRGSISGGEIAISTPFIFAMLLTAGVSAACAGLALSCIVADLFLRKPPLKLVFNAAQYVLSLAASGAALLLLAGARTMMTDPRLAAIDLGIVLIAGAVFFALNSTLPCIAIALDQNLPALSILRRDFSYQLATAGVLVMTSPLVVAAAGYSLMLLPILLLPALAVQWSSQLSLNNEHQSLHDSLTSLPNRTLFHARVTDAMPMTHFSAIMLIDLDHFKEVNDTLGHRTGDKLLRAVAERLCHYLGPAATVSRLGGDEFAVMLPDTSSEDALDAAHAVLDVLQSPFSVDDFSLSVEASIGVALYPDHGTDSGTLLRCADVAMYLAKQSGRGAELYSLDRDQHSRQRLRLLGQVQDAISDGQFILHYQPQLELRSGRVVAVEALVRWQHPEFGLLHPVDFVPLAEHSIHMSALTSYAIEQALTQQAAWFAQGIDVRVAVNVPANALHAPDFVQGVAAALSRFGVAARSLDIEITESTIMANPARALASLQALDALGVHLSIDDFGTGYSSLAYLKQLPVHAVKIDKSFMLNVTGDADDGRIVQSIVGLAKNLGLQTVAEGVEDEATLSLLRELGCDLAQGYHICRPVRAAQLSDILVRRVTGVRAGTRDRFNPTVG